MTRHLSQGRRGFTLIELLVVIAIIAILIGLLLPAVQKVREAAARIKCSNNIKQLALGAQTYHDVQNGFPRAATSITITPPVTPAGPWTNGRDGNWGPTWQVLILPYIEQDPLFKRWNMAQGTFDNTANNNVSNQVLATYQCPSDSQTVPLTVTASAAGPGGATTANFARGNYGINGGATRGSASTNPAANRRGVVHSRTLFAARIADVTDGTANTVCVTELRTHNATGDNSFGAWGVPGAAVITSFNDNGTPAWPATGLPASTAAQTPNCDARTDQCKSYTPWCNNAFLGVDPVFGCEDNMSATGARSRHTGGVNVGLVDGTVRFVRDSVDGQVWMAATTIAGGEVPGDW